MLNAAKGRRWREVLLVEIKNKQELEAWLRQQPHEVSIAFAARAALRALPFVQTASRSRHYTRDIVLPIFRANGISWVAAIFPADKTGLAAARAAADADAAAHATDPFDRAASAAYACAHAVRTAPAAAAGRIIAARSATAFSSAQADAFSHRATDGSHRDVFVDHFASYGLSALSMDATRLDAGVTSSYIAGSPLWPRGQPSELQSLWQEMKEALHAANEGWQVWITWYDDRLNGRVSDEERELAYVRVDDELWEQGPAIVNAEIKRRIEAGAPHPERESEQEPPPFLPQPIANVPSAVSFGWTSKATITVFAGPENWPVLPFREASRITRTGSKLAGLWQKIPRDRYEMEDGMRGRIMRKHSINMLPIFQFSPKKEIFFSLMPRPASSARCSQAMRTYLRCRSPRNSRCFLNSRSAFVLITQRPKISTSPCAADIWKLRYRSTPSKVSSKACGTIRPPSSSRMSLSRLRASRSLSPRLHPLMPKSRSPTVHNRPPARSALLKQRPSLNGTAA